MMSRPPTPDESLDISSLPPHKPNDNRHLGLAQVHPKTTDHEAIAKKKVDIIFMHGLDAQSPKTWIAWVREDDPNSGNVNWLSDDHMLPAAMPDARILTYDWNGNYDRTASRERLLGHADALLERITRDREDFNRQSIPLMFVASCFSGLLLAQALVRATEIYLPRYKNNRKVLDSVAGVAFLGTPFGGSWETGNLVASLRVEIAAGATREYNRELIEYLRPGTRDAPSPLEDLVQRFTYMIRHEDFNFGIVCFYETRDTDFSPYKSKLPPSYAGQLDANGHGIVVDQNSACLQGVDKVGLDVRHNMLHKFNSPQNEGFKHLTSRLREFQSRAELKSSKRAKLHDKCLEALYFGGINYEPGQIREASETTCQWMLEHPIYSNWHGEGHGVFWILGSPGSGKSTLIKHAIKKDQELYDEHSTLILSFFFHNQGKRLQHTVEGLLRGLLRQLLEKVPGQMHSFCNKLDTNAPKGLHDSRWTAPYLVQLFEEALTAVLEHINVRLFIDALDECRVGEEEDDTQDIEDLVQRLRNIEERMRVKPHCLSICFACRHFPLLAPLYHDPYIKAEWENGGAIEEYVQQELLRITGNDQLRSNLQTEIVDSANGNFLWANLVTAKAIRLHTRGFDVEEAIRSTPKQISEIYAGILRRLSRGASEMSIEIFQWLCFAQESLPLRTFRFALNINVQESRCSSISDLPDSLRDNSDRRMERMIRTLSGGLAEVKGEEEHVLLIHQSVKDFLIKDGFRILDPGQDTHQRVLASGHGRLLNSTLWWLTEPHLSQVVQSWMDDFDPNVIVVVLMFEPEEFGDDVIDLGQFVVNGVCDTRSAIAALESSERQVLRDNSLLCDLAETHGDWTDAYREAIITPKGLKDWHVIDEIFACFLFYAYIHRSEPSFAVYNYSRASWMHHAVQTANNGELLMVKSSLRKFCSRLKPQYATVYSRLLSILHKAAALSDPFVLTELLACPHSSSLDVNSVCASSGHTPMVEAIRNGCVDNVRTLLKQKEIDVNCVDISGEAALSHAADEGSLLITELLIQHGASIDNRDHHGQTALLFAVYRDHHQIMDLLLQNGASIHFKTSDNVDAIDYASDQCLYGLAQVIIRKIRRQEKEIWGDRWNRDQPL